MLGLGDNGEIVQRTVERACALGEDCRCYRAGRIAGMLEEARAREVPEAARQAIDYALALAAGGYDNRRVADSLWVVYARPRTLWARIREALA
ncbi:MAG TPA: hypothetical protein VF024_11195 [Solirubrobacteraceae bacterium]